MSETILITGSNRGLGLELVRQYAARNWRVLACCRQPQAAKDLNALQQAHPNLSVHRLDVADERQRAELVTALDGQPIDILLCNAGISGPKPQGFGPIDTAGWLDTLRINVIAPLQLAVDLVDNVAASGRKIIAGMGSRMGSIADNGSGGMYAYRSSKAALHMVMKNLAVDLADRGIIAVALHPGWVRTNMGGDQAPLSPEQSIGGLIRVLEGLGPADSGRLWSYDGQELPW